MSTNTPWGPSQHSIKHFRGCVTYETASHGGIKISRSLFDYLTLFTREHGISFNNALWFEEDVDYMLAIQDLARNPAYREALSKTYKILKEVNANFVVHYGTAHYFEYGDKNTSMQTPSIGSTLDIIADGEVHKFVCTFDNHELSLESVCNRCSIPKSICFHSAFWCSPNRLFKKTADTMEEL